MGSICYLKGGISMPVFLKKTYLRAIPLYAVSMVGSMLLVQRIHLEGWIGLAVKAMVITVIFAVSAFLLYLTGAERKQIFLLGRKRK